MDDTARLSFPGQVFVDDFNNDGRTDIYVGTYGDETGPPTAADVLYLQTRSGGFRIDTRTDLPLTWAHGSSHGDLNNDGWTDIFSSGLGGAPSYIYWGSPDGFVVDETEITVPITFAEPYGRHSVHRSRIQDFDGDGQSDLLLGTASRNHAIVPGDPVPLVPTEIVYSYGRRGEERVVLPFPDVPWMEDWGYDLSASQIGDLDGDGDMDLVLAYVNNRGPVIDGVFYPLWDAIDRGLAEDDKWAHSIVQVLRNDGDRFYTDVSDHRVLGTARNTTSVFEIEILDFDGDGHLDLYVDPAEPPRAPPILLGDGAFGFAPPDSVDIAFDNYGTVADLDGDGAADFFNVWPASEGLPQTWQVWMAQGRDRPEVWHGTSADDAVRLHAQREAHGAVGNDHIVGTQRADRLHGGWNDDLLVGRNGRDRLFGEHGADTLVGGRGKDVLSGGMGADVFDLSAARLGHDTIRDFRDDTDTLRLARALQEADIGAFLDRYGHEEDGHTILDFGARGSVTIRTMGLDALADDIAFA